MWCPWVRPQEGVAAEPQPVSPDPAPLPTATQLWVAVWPQNHPEPPQHPRSAAAGKGRAGI